MREYLGPPYSVLEVALLPGDPGRLIAATNSAAYLWPLDGGEPTVLAWDENAWGQPALEVSPDGRWVLAGPAGRLRVWDVSRSTVSPPRLLVERTLVLSRFGAANRLTLIHQ